MALLPEREARPHLWRLLQGGYVRLQEVPKTADHNPRTTCFLWHVDTPAALRVLERDVLKTAHLMQQRAEAECAPPAPASRGGAGEASGAGGGPAPAPRPDGMGPGGCSNAAASAQGEAARREALVAARKSELLDSMTLQLINTAMLLRVL